MLGAPQTTGAPPDPFQCEVATKALARLDANLLKADQRARLCAEHLEYLASEKTRLVKGNRRALSDGPQLVGALDLIATRFLGVAALAAPQMAALGEAFAFGSAAGQSLRDAKWGPLARWATELALKSGLETTPSGKALVAMYDEYQRATSLVELAKNDKEREALRATVMAALSDIEAKVRDAQARLVEDNAFVEAVQAEHKALQKFLRRKCQRA